MRLLNNLTHSLTHLKNSVAPKLLAAMQRFTPDPTGGGWGSNYSAICNAHISFTADGFLLPSPNNPTLHHSEPALQTSSSPYDTIRYDRRV